MSEKRPNVLWLMSDQHNANCTGYAGHPNVRTPNLDRIAARGVHFRQAFANNPICAPSRISFITGQYIHSHGMVGNNLAEYPESNNETLACQFRRYGYQTGLFGKAHMVRKWDEAGFETIRYTDLCDALRTDPQSTHYFRYLDDLGLADYYEEGTPKPGQEYTMDGSAPATLPYKHSIEHYTGEETLRFLRDRDTSRPFFAFMSFQRPHSPIAPAAEHYHMYDPENIVLPDNAFDFLENRLAGKPTFMREIIESGREYPLATTDRQRLKRCLASYFALISVIDGEIGRVLDWLEKTGELENTVIVYTADHGDFAGEHGLFHKNLGIYDSIHRIPFLLSWPGGPQGKVCDELIEAVDLFPTLSDLCRVPLPEICEGESVAPVATGQAPGKDAAFCEWDCPDLNRRVGAIRTRRYRLVFYGGPEGGELYDHQSDPGETRNVYNDPDYAATRQNLTDRLLAFTMGYATRLSIADDRKKREEHRYAPTPLLHKHKRYWSDLRRVYHEDTAWPPPGAEYEIES